jgi:SPP1 gp7 family putative phage head morphogenesis protein
MINFQDLVFTEGTLFELLDSPTFNATQASLEIAFSEIEKRILRTNGEWTKSRLMDIRRAIAEEIANSYAGIVPSVQSESVAAASIVYNSMSFTEIPKRVIDIINNSQSLIQGYTVNELFSATSDNHARVLKVMLSSYVSQGASLPTILKDMRDKHLSLVDNKLRTSVYSTIKFAREEATYASYRELEKTGVVTGYEFSAKLDGGTSELCRSLDGRRWKGTIDQMPFRPGLHLNCRSKLVALTIDESDYKETSYRDWFESKDEAFQKKVLGNKKFEAYQKGTYAIDTLSDVKKAGVKLGMGEIKDNL